MINSDESNMHKEPDVATEKCMKKEHCTLEISLFYNGSEKVTEVYLLHKREN